jgi:hypothetical protein
MFYSVDPLAETWALIQMSRTTIAEVHKTRASMVDTFETTRRAIRRSHQLIEQTDALIRKMGPLVSGVVLMKAPHDEDACVERQLRNVLRTNEESDRQ